jgi:DNA repair protein SbcD/Mre11
MLYLSNGATSEKEWPVMVRVLHTGDWHIGQTLRGYSREYEQARVFDQLIEIVTEREIDLLIVAGDIFDSQNPSGETQRLFYETIERLHRARSTMKTVIVAGNHDAAGRLEAPHPLLERFNVRVVGNVRRRDGRIDVDRHHVPIAYENGEIVLHVLAVSYPTAACLPNVSRLEDDYGSPIVRAVRELYEELYESIRPKLQGLPLIVTGHLHVMGAIESEGAERRILVGGQHAVPSDIFPAEASYVALGHLHKSQHVGRETVRYSGSLIPLSATEQPYRHSVTLLSVDGNGIATEQIPLERPVPFLRLPITGEIRLADLHDHLMQLELANDLESHLWPFVQVRVTREGLLSGYREELDRIAEEFPVRIVEARVQQLAGIAAGILGEAAINFTHLAEREPEEMFKLAFQKKFGSEPSSAHLGVFHRVQAEV